MPEQENGWPGKLPTNVPSAITETSNCNVHSNYADHCNAHSTDLGDLSGRIIPTQETYAQLQEAYDYLNWNLFENALPNCLITLQRRGRTYGYYAPDRFRRRKDGHRTDEIALNPQYFPDGTEEILSTLAHEMAHVWQHHFGKPGRAGYHNYEWAAKMQSIGLHPSSTGKEGGKQTGDSMAEYVLPDSPFARAVKELLARGFEVTWTEARAHRGSCEGVDEGEHDGGSPYGSRGSHSDRGLLSGKRTKYTCPHGDLNAWAKPGAELLCGKHLAKMNPVPRPRGPGASMT